MLISSALSSFTGGSREAEKLASLNRAGPRQRESILQQTPFNGLNHPFPFGPSPSIENVCVAWPRRSPNPEFPCDGFGWSLVWDEPSDGTGDNGAGV